ncbi:MAG: ankyrin repeat-containing domain protein [Olpidium bornovanus]|uniref:Ankyrin repeat-containing domain protein n=1 Tax=Olpidium bornovanus TaxID=278681 RepID=A0A8H7ZQQ2_9FUNG|nr:MAG: ankyrin repeat-containing domain protein [Olpidium bornovanus]
MEKVKPRKRTAGSTAAPKSAGKARPSLAASLPALSANEKTSAASRRGTADAAGGIQQPLPPRRLSRIPTKDEWVLLNAAEKGDVDTVYALVWKGTDVMCRKPVFGTNPIGLAARAGHTKIVSILMEAGGVISDADDYGVTPLHWAATGGHSALIAAMLTQASMPVLGKRIATAPDPSNGSQEDSTGTAQPHALPSSGGNRPASTGDRERPGTTGSTANADRTGVSLPDVLTAKDQYGSTALHFAAARNDDATVYQLVTAGSDVALRNNGGRRPQDLTTSETLKAFLEEEELKLLKSQTSRRSAASAAEKEKADKKGKRAKKKRPASVSVGRTATGSAPPAGGGKSSARRAASAAADEVPNVVPKEKWSVAMSMSTPSVAAADAARPTSKDDTAAPSATRPSVQPRVNAKHHRRKSQPTQRAVPKTAAEGG